MSEQVAAQQISEADTLAILVQEAAMSCIESGLAQKIPCSLPKWL